MKKLILLPILLLAACSNDRNEPARVPTPELAAVTTNQPSRHFDGALETVKVGACERLKELGSLASSGPRFSYFRTIRTRDLKWAGAIDVNESPFTQLVLGEKFVNGDEAAFYKKAQGERAAGRLGSMKWMYVNLMNNIGLLSNVQHSATNDKLLEKFPGIFGKDKRLEASLPLMLARRAADIDAVPEAPEILGTRMPLFPGDGEWSDFAKQTRISLGAAQNGLNGEPRERLCALVLMHQHFAQLLRIKGHSSPVIEAGDEHWLSSVEPLSNSQPEFRTVELPGAFFELASSTSIVLPQDIITGYDPRKNMLGITDLVPDGYVSHMAGDLGDALSLMEALTYGFELTSPAAPMVEKQGYLLGDVQAEGGKALLPGEAHALSLGLLTMHFKNLSLMHIHRVNAQGLKVREGESPAGIVLAGENGRVRLMEVVRLTKLVSNLETAMDRFLSNPGTNWEKLNPVYSRKTLASLFGPALLPEANELLTASERSSVVKDSLKQLKLPLALLLAKLGRNSAGCVSTAKWDTQTGAIEPLSLCTPNERAELKAVMRQLADDTGSPVAHQLADSL